MLPSKYSKLLSISWQNGLVYRAGVFLWRFRVFLSTVLALSIWQVVFASKNEVLSYDQPQMITYIFVISILQSIIMATALHPLASQVYNGEITNWLLKPIGFYKYLFVYDLADKAKNLVFVLGETIILYFIYQPVLTLPSLSSFSVFIFWSLLGLVLNFFITILFGTIGFYSPEVWAPKFLFFMIVDFVSGKLFPLDILPEIIQKIMNFTPIPFLSYYQTQLFLGRVTPQEVLPLTLVLIFWCVTIGVITIKTWEKGFRDYQAVGR